MSKAMIVSGKKLRRVAMSGMIENCRESSIEPVSVELHLDNQITRYKLNGPVGPFQPPNRPDALKSVTTDGEPYVVPPNGRILGCSQEYIRMPCDVMGFVQTKGSLARGFLMLQLCDGQIDPGYQGKVTFEIVNLSEFYYSLVPGMAVARLFILELSEEVEPYKGRYQNASKPTAMTGEPRE
ncbi:MAG: dCTP deaminase [Myxococcota bacterium]